MNDALPSRFRSPAWRLSLGALGVVFGDIGTSPLYALRACFTDVPGMTTGPADVLGVLSMIFWSLALVISAKYVGLVLRADHEGEGGVLALMTLVVAERPRAKAVVAAIGWAGLAGCALFFGDGALTPAVSVLSAVEGLELASPAFARAVLPLSVLTLLVLFAFQRHGTERVGRLFGPVMVVWFGTIAALGGVAIAGHPEVAAAVNPLHAVDLVSRHAGVALVLFASVFLAVTGGEALYADLGHFGRGPIVSAWLWLVWPALVVNYFGQGALLLTNPAAVSNPFYLLAPQALLLPLVLLATAATVIASQAVISGVFSVTQQCQQLGVLPPSKIVFSSEENIGQVYVPMMNWLLCALTIGLVLAFGSSAALSGAYGIAVSGTMVVVTGLMLLHEGGQRTAGAWVRFGLLVALGAIDLAFFAANLVKIPQGGWFPLAYGMGVLLVMRTWRSGRAEINRQITGRTCGWEEFRTLLEREQPRSVPGVAVFLTPDPREMPATLLRNIRTNGVLHANTIVFGAVTEPVPHVARGQRLEIERLDRGIRRVTAHVGYMEAPDVPRFLYLAERLGLGARARDAFYVVEREDVVLTGSRVMSRWRKLLFMFLCRNARGLAARLRIPPERAVTIGGQVAL